MICWPSSLLDVTGKPRFQDWLLIIVFRFTDRLISDLNHGQVRLYRMLRDRLYASVWLVWCSIQMIQLDWHIRGHLALLVGNNVPFNIGLVQLI